jgi:hypothetical protein
VRALCVPERGRGGRERREGKIRAQTATQEKGEEGGAGQRKKKENTKPPYCKSENATVNYRATGTDSDAGRQAGAQSEQNELWKSEPASERTRDR